MSSNFRENLRNELNYQGIMIKELSAKTGIPVATLDCYLGARATIPSIDAAYKIAQALKVPVDYLISGEDINISIPSRKIKSHEARNLINLIGSLSPEQCRAIYDMILSIKTKKLKK